MTTTLSTTKVDRIRELAAELETLGKTALIKAIEAGTLLRECKQGLVHGQWLPWLEENFSFTDRTARRWMKVSEDAETGKLKSDTVSNLTEAYRITTESRPMAACPFKMPLPGQRLLLLMKASGSNKTPICAAIEPMDETYVQVTWTENAMSHEGEGETIGSIAGTRRGIHKDLAWKFLTHNSHLREQWNDAVCAYVPWERPILNSTENPNLSESDEFGWLDECFQLEIQ